MDSKDAADAQLVADIADALRTWQARTGRPAATKVLREAVWFYWQNPRLPRPLINGKYPRAAMWSHDAAEMVLAGAAEARGQLVIEHIEPMSRLLRSLINTPEDAGRVAELLGDGLRVVVVTRAESDALPDSGDPDERYASAGLTLSDFRSLDDWETHLAARVPRPVELEEAVPGDVLWDHMGREWTIAEVTLEGMRLLDENGDETPFTWHGLLTLGARREPR